jgi:glycosyltransferase involved in cell wall biosynthesis
VTADRIAVVHNLRRGGAHRRLRAQLEELDGQVREFTLSSASPATSDPFVVPYEPRADSQPEIRRPPYRYDDMHRLIRAWLELGKAVERWSPDVVYANPCCFLQAPALLIGLRTPSVYYCDEPRRLFYDESARDSTNRLTRPMYAALRQWERRVDRRATTAAAQVLTNSSFTMAAIDRAYGRKATVLPPPLAGTFTPASCDGQEHVLSVGTLIPSKGHDLAVESVASSGIGLPLVVVAPRHDSPEADRLTALAARLGVKLDIRIGISDEELRDLYRAALVTLYLARMEPLGLVSLESQACGTPVIVSAEGGLPGTIAEAETGWSVARNAEAVAAAIKQLEPGVRHFMGRSAVQRAESWRAAGSGSTLSAILGGACR